MNGIGDILKSAVTGLGSNPKVNFKPLICLQELQELVVEEKVQMF